jgi:hypothetical protein
MTKQILTCAAILMLAAGVSAQPDSKGAAANLTGTWNMGLQGGHVIPVALVLKQDRATLTGTLSMPTQNPGQTVDVALEGDVAEGMIALAGTVDRAKEPTTIKITGKLNDEGALEGTLTMSGSGAHARELPYTAERLKERK